MHGRISEPTKFEGYFLLGAMRALWRWKSWFSSLLSATICHCCMIHKKCLLQFRVFKLDLTLKLNCSPTELLEHICDFFQMSKLLSETATYSFTVRYQNSSSSKNKCLSYKDMTKLIELGAPYIWTKVSSFQVRYHLLDLDASEQFVKITFGQRSN